LGRGRYAAVAAVCGIVGVVDPAVAFGGPEYRQLRVGMHVSALKVHLFDWRFE